MSRKIGQFGKLSEEASECRLCPRMADQPAVLSLRNGSLGTDILFVAEAPGRFGAGRTGIPFTGDRSGENFDLLLKQAGLARTQIFITNTVLCNPLDAGKNARPAAREIHNCSYYLRSIMELIQPRLVVTLGGVGLLALNHLLGTRYRLDTNAAKPLETKKFILLPLYHPSPRVANWRRPLNRQKKDFRKIVHILENLSRPNPC